MCDTRYLKLWDGTSKYFDEVSEYWYPVATKLTDSPILIEYDLTTAFPQTIGPISTVVSYEQITG